MDIYIYIYIYINAILMPRQMYKFDYKFLNKKIFTITSQTLIVSLYCYMSF